MHLNFIRSTAFSGRASATRPLQVQTKTMQMEDELRRFLTQPRPAEEVLALAKQLGISERTLKIAKRNLGILSERRADQWLWRLPEQEGKGVTP